MFKYQILNQFIVQYKDLPEQGSDAWKDLRKDFIGGSEVATILKQNKNKSVNKLILEKLGFDRFQGNVITHWGNVFEEMIRLHCEEVFNCQIRETGSIPYEHGSLSYSPDGLAVIPTNNLIKRFGQLPDSLDAKSPAQLILFEFKCPHSRLPSSEVPEHYWPQVNIGMNIINIMEAAIFVQATYRRCAFDKLLYNTYHNPYGHFKRADTTNNPIECGFMIIYADQTNDYIDNLKEALVEIGEANEIYLSNQQCIIDIGPINEPSLLEEIMGNCVNKSFKVDYSFRHMYDQDVFQRDKYTIDMYDQSLKHNSLKALTKKVETINNVICILPFKMLNVFMTPITKNHDYIKETNAHSKAISVLQCINDHRGQDNKADVSKSIRKYKL